MQSRIHKRRWRHSVRAILLNAPRHFRSRRAVDGAPHLLALLFSIISTFAAHAQMQSADEFFHRGAQSYLSNNIPMALEMVTNGLAVYPDDAKLKKLEELLKQQSQQQSDQQQKDDKDQSQQEQNDQKQNQQQSNKEQQKEDQQKAEQEKQKNEQQQAEKDKSPGTSEEKKGEPQPAAAAQMTPEQAKQLLENLKNEEQLLIFRPATNAERRNLQIKDW